MKTAPGPWEYAIAAQCPSCGELGELPDEVLAKLAAREWVADWWHAHRCQP